jgi:hypothetical protein
MARDWESTLRTWGRPPSATEATKCDNAARAVKDAIANYRALQNRTVRVFAQGSYNNRTNVRAESDVDISVCCMDSIFPDFSLASGFTRETVGLQSADYTYPAFKNDVEAALVSYFGRSAVARGDKAFDIHANTYRVDADVVACFEHRRYTSRDALGTYLYESGTEFQSDRGLRVVNWPEQNYSNGVAKNQVTGERFKAMVRSLKNLRNEMASAGYPSAKPIASYFVECLVWNAPNPCFARPTYTEDMRNVLLFLFQGTNSDDKCTEWGEENERKYLFRTIQPWTREQASSFIVDAWHYLGLGS